ncbi:MAG: hypothetical protein WBJ84_08225 [Bacteroidales bacterium]
MNWEKFKSKSVSQRKSLNSLLFVNKLLIIAIAGIFTFGTTSCSSQKKLAKKHAKEARLAQIEQAKADLHEIINDDGFIALDVKEQKLQKVKDLNLDDKEVKALIPKAEEKLKRDRAAYQKKLDEDRQRAEAERLEKERLEKEKTIKTVPLQQALIDIANAPNLREANERIAETLKLFESPNATVLILINVEGDSRDYDRPTTIQKYLELLKDQKRYNNDIENVRYNAAGKITELELKTRY